MNAGDVACGIVELSIFLESVALMVLRGYRLSIGLARAWPWESDEYMIHTADPLIVGPSIIMVWTRNRS